MDKDRISILIDKRLSLGDYVIRKKLDATYYIVTFFDNRVFRYIDIGGLRVALVPKFSTTGEHRAGGLKEKLTEYISKAEC